MATDTSTPPLAVDYDPFAGGALSRVVPTTEPQREVWLADQLGRDASLAYNESVSLQFRGALNPSALQSSLQAMFDRHDALRASFDPDGESLCIREPCKLKMSAINLSNLTETDRAAALQARLLASVETPFSVSDDLLFRAELLRLAPDDHRLVLSAHHIVCDGWSWWILVRELGALYAQAVTGRAADLPAAASFADYALAEALNPQGETFSADQAYWRSQFVGELPVLDLPTDRPRPLRRSFASRREDHTLEAGLVTSVRRLGARRGASLFATLLAGFAGLVSRLAGQSQVVVGIPAAGQSVDGQDQLVGHCVNLLPLRFSIDASQPFAQSLDAAQATLLDALDHQRYTFGSLLKQLPIARDPGRLPLVSVMFNIDQALDQESHGFPGLALDFTVNARRSENFELSINAVQVDGQLRLECQYSTALFDEATVRRWLSAYEALLRQAVEHPERPFSALAIVDASAGAELAALQPEPVAFDRLCRMHEHFERQCDRTPDNIAVRSGGQALTYAELEARANRIARLLRDRGAGRGKLVGLALDRGVDMLAGLLAILKSGAGYVPLDPQFPPDRLAYMVADAGLALLLTQGQHIERLGAGAVPVLALEELAADLATRAVTRLGRDDDSSLPESPAYVIYTSGSTGRPKGVQVPHRAVANFIMAMQREPGIAAEDRLVAVTTLSFDIAVLELLLPLSVGAEVILASRDVAMDGVALAALLTASRATLMQATPATWRVLMDAGWQGGGKFKVLCGGEPLPADLALQLLARCGELWNVYGPTETTVWSTCARVLAPAAGMAPDIHIGRPIANTRIWILDPNGELCPLGVPGEICIGGDGVSLGYLDRPDLTADRFVPERFVSSVADGLPSPLLYRTGDRGRWRHDGNLEHLGRLDFQVKVRGYRIELGEIENQLAQHPDVARALVIVREDRPGDVRLVAYVVMRDGRVLDDAALIRHLKVALPDYMIPQHLLALAALPLLPNGKNDRRALPAPGEIASTVKVDMVAPRDALEASIATAMATALGRTTIGINDGFFELGGHSLLAAQLCSRLTRELGVRVELRALFEAPTVARLAAFVRAASISPNADLATALVVPVRADQSRAPMSLQQQRVWVLEHLDPGQVTYNTPSAHRLHGPMDVAALDRAFREMLRRQAVLRTSLVQEEDDAVQIIAQSLDIGLLPAIDLSALPAAQREKRLMMALDAMTSAPFLLDGSPLFRAKLFRLADNDHVLYFMTHHLIWDGWSFDIFYDEMSALYDAYRQGLESPLPELDVSYGDFSAWQRGWMAGGELDRQLSHWKQHLAGNLEPLQLPEDFPRPARASGKGGTGWVKVDRAMTEALRALGTRSDATLFMTLLTAYYVLLHRLSGQTDLIVGLPMRNRPSDALERVMGFFVNMLPMRVRLDPAMSFEQVLVQVRSAVVECFAFPDVPFEDLVRELRLTRDPSRSPLYQAVFSFQDVRARKTRWGPLQHEHLLLFQNGISSDLGIWFLEHEEGLTGALAFNTDVLSAATADRISQRFVALLGSVCRDPSLALGDLEILSVEDQSALAQWNNTAAAAPEKATIHELFLAQAERTPARSAVRVDGQATSYRDLELRSQKIADALAARQVGPGALVGVCLNRDVDMVATLLGILRSGAGYVPLDPAYPADRLRYMAEDAGLAMIVSQAGLADAIGWPQEKSLSLDRDAVEIAASVASSAPPRSDGESTAYVIYTSGSTGKPKGVVIPHRAAVNFLASMQRVPGLLATDRLLAVTTISFDIAVLEIFGPLCVGAEVVLADRDTAMDGSQLAALIEDTGANLMQATPSTWRLLVEAGWQGRPGFKALCGGEPLPPDLAASLISRCGELWNMYGPTETTVWSTCTRVVDPGQGISIGAPIANTTVWILDARNQPCPAGVAGEICIGGRGVSLGYLNRPELTAEKFIDDVLSSPFGANEGIAAPKLYRTGDRGRWLGDGNLEHLGRLDFQVKVRGHRIELGEIDIALVLDSAVAQAVTVTTEVRPGDVRLVAYVVPERGKTLEVAALVAALKKSLPAYMVPQHVISLPALPLLLNGKIDRKSLPSPLSSPASEVASSASADTHADSRVGYLVQVWSQLLSVPVTATDNFFDLGGHSMLAVQMANRVAKDTGVRIKLMNLVTQNLAQIALELPLPAGKDPESGQGWSTHLRDRLLRLFGRKGAPGQ